MKPLVSDSQTWDQATLEEQRAWAQAQADEAITVLGQEEGWAMLLDDELLWPEHRTEIMGYARIDNCRPSKGSDQPARTMLDLSNLDFHEPFEGAARLKQHWIDQGWTVTYVIDPEEAPEPEEYFRADREDGAMLSLSASENYMSLAVYSSCSDRVRTYGN